MIDFHVHLDLYKDPAAAVKCCLASKAYVLSVTTTPRAWGGTKRLATGNPRIRTALGLHPQIAHERAGELGLFDAILPETRYVGEVGLDGSPELKPHQAVQSRVFTHVLNACARAGGRIITIHSRRATDQVLDHLEQAPGCGVPVLHWFSGTKGQLQRADRMGCWFSVGPAMVRSAKGFELLRAMPRSRVLTETDGPFALSAGGAPLQPAEVAPALTAIGTAWGVSEQEADAELLANFKTLVMSFTGIGPE